MQPIGNESHLSVAKNVGLNTLVELDELEQRIRETADAHEPVETTLATSERIIARVTDGIYREPWAAFRELVANAYDADASYVVIETGQPDFHRMTVRDDGIGMTPATLAYVLKNIGGSSKRTAAGAELMTSRSGAPDLSPGGRKVIGKIGIGLFAVAQLTQHFQIITKAPGEIHRLSATIRLRTHDEEQMQHAEDEYVAGTVVVMSEKVPDAERDAQGTSVVLYQMRDEVRRTLQSVKLWRAASVETGAGESIRKPPEFHIGYGSSDSPVEPARRLPPRAQSITIANCSQLRRCRESAVRSQCRQATARPQLPAPNSAAYPSFCNFLSTSIALADCFSVGVRCGMRART